MTVGWRGRRAVYQSDPLNRGARGTVVDDEADKRPTTLREVPMQTVLFADIDLRRGRGGKIVELVRESLSLDRYGLLGSFR